MAHAFVFAAPAWARIAILRWQSAPLPVTHTLTLATLFTRAILFDLLAVNVPAVLRQRKTEKY